MEYRRDQPVDLATGRASLRPAQFDPALAETAAKLETSNSSSSSRRASAPRSRLAVAFTMAHPDVTSAIIGPRTMQQLEDLLNGVSLTLDDATIDRIDEIEPPGTARYSPNAAFPPPSLTDVTRRRRPLAERAADT